MIVLCRVCLCSYRHMHTINNTVLQEVWEKLTNSKFNNEEGKPMGVCYICYAHIQRSYELMQRASNAEQLLTHIVKNSSLYTPHAISRISTLAYELDYKYNLEPTTTHEFKDIKQEMIEIKTENEQADDIGIKCEDYGLQSRKCNLNEVPQNSKVIILDATSKDGDPLAPTVLKIIQNNSEPLDVSHFSKMCFAKPVSLEGNDILPEISIHNEKVLPENLIIKEELPIEFMNPCDSEPVNWAQDISASATSVIASTSSYRSNKYTKSGIPKNKPKPAYPCDMCERKCTSKYLLKVHYRKHTKEKPFACQLCDFKTATNRNLKRHMEYKHSTERKYACDLCQYKCVSKHEFITHTRIHTKERPYICDFCGRCFRRKSHLDNHIQCKHTPDRILPLMKRQRKPITEKKFACNECDYRCKLKSALNNHIQHRHTNERNFLCHICDYRSVTKANLILHVRTHTKEKPYTCDLCEYRSAHKTGLKSHILNIHLQQKDFSCNVCEMRFVSNSKLNQHMQVHTKERPFKCELCGHSFPRKAHLQNHTQYKHTKEKNFACHICEHKFVTKGDLNQHLKRHNKENPKSYKSDSDLIEKNDLFLEDFPL